jgi:hypothetical protein
MRCEECPSHNRSLRVRYIYFPVPYHIFSFHRHSTEKTKTQNHQNIIKYRLIYYLTQTRKKDKPPTASSFVHHGRHVGLSSTSLSFSFSFSFFHFSSPFSFLLHLLSYSPFHPSSITTLHFPSSSHFLLFFLIISIFSPEPFLTLVLNQASSIVILVYILILPFIITASYVGSSPQLTFPPLISTISPPPSGHIRSRSRISGALRQPAIIQGAASSCSDQFIERVPGDLVGTDKDHRVTTTIQLQPAPGRQKKKNKVSILSSS